MSAEAWLAIGGIASTLAAWLTSRRRYSGRVSGTEADRLWNEQEKFRERLQKRIEELEYDLMQSEFRRKLSELKCRDSVHTLRNELMTMQFIVHPDIPDDIKRSMLDRQTSHVSDIHKEIADLEAEMREKGILL